MQGLRRCRGIIPVFGVVVVVLFIVEVGGGSHAPPPIVGIPASSIKLGHLGVIGHLGGYVRGGGVVPRSGGDPLLRRAVGG